MYNVGLIRVLTTSDEDLLNEHGKIIENVFKDIKVESRCIEDQYEGIHDEETELIAVPKIINLAQKYFSKKDAIIISCAGDPALKELREVMDIPIIGAGESAALISQIYGEKFGIVGITEKVPKSYEKILEGKMVGDTLIQGISSTNDLAKEDGYEKVLDHCKKLKDLGAEVLTFACTGLSTNKFAPLIERDLPLPVVDCVYAEAVFTYASLIKKNFYKK